VLKWILPCAVLVMAGCAAPSQPPLDVTHVHGVAYDAASETVYLASHHGLARGHRDGGDWAWEFVGERYDYMGFTKDTVRPGTFYSSGHPDDPRAYGGVHLGLRRSTDDGETWEQRSLKGEVDFHALTALHGGEGWLAGFWQGEIKVSRDGGLTWTDHPAPPAPVIALASAEGKVLAATPQGLYQTTDPETFSNWTRLPGPSQGTVSSAGSSLDGTTILAGTGDGRAGSVHRSTDGGASWTVVEHALLRDAPGQVLFAFDGSDHAFAALGDGTVLESTDAGATWAKTG
jgi:photosystem II stability/assembly factor-like uncharacterized protein